MEKIGEKFEKAEQKEPKILYHFFFSPHVTAKDFENLGAAFKTADIYVPEIPRCPLWLKELLGKVAQGKISLDEVYQEFPELNLTSARRREFEIIHNSKKPILIADITPKNYKYAEKRTEDGALHRDVMNNFRFGNFKESLAKLRLYIKSEADLQMEREKKIKKNLKNQIKEFLKENPEYVQKDNLKVLIRLGAYHTKLYRDLKQDKLEVSREFNRLPGVYLSFDEAKRRIIAGKEVTDELLARGIIENYFYDFLEKISEDSEKIIQVVRKLSVRLSLKNIEQISTSKNLSQNFGAGLISELEKFNIKIPRSEKEMDEMLGIEKK